MFFCLLCKLHFHQILKRRHALVVLSFEFVEFIFQINQLHIPYFREQFPRKLFFFGSWSAASIQGRKLFKGGNYCFLTFWVRSYLGTHCMISTYVVAFSLLSTLSYKPQELFKSFAIMHTTDSVQNPSLPGSQNPSLLGFQILL